MALRRRQPGPLREGIYDEILSSAIDVRLRELAGSTPIKVPILDGRAVEDQLATYLREALQIVFATKTTSTEKVKLAQEVLTFLQSKAPNVFREGESVLINELLQAIAPSVPGGQQKNPTRPRGSLLASSLITNAQNESVLEHLISEFPSADQVDLLCSFIKLSGVEKVRDAIERHCGLKKRIRILTTTYMQATEVKAIDLLHRLGAEIRISYDVSATRLHAKAWLFHRHSGYSTAYVGSSNLSHTAQTEGLEWNVRVAEADRSELLDEMAEVFESYWEDADKFEPYNGTVASRKRLTTALEPNLTGSLIQYDLEPKDWQKPILRDLKHARDLDRHRNLLVAATGTGKTLMAAFDYADLYRDQKINSLLFIAHHKEILEQSQEVFRQVLRRDRFGERWFDGSRPADHQHVFASIQTLDANLKEIDPGRYDMVIVDEVHHAAAASYDRVLSLLKPKELLGLTATPERTDGRVYERHFPLPYIGNLRVWDAIQKQVLVPFQYYALDVDGLDLTDVRWEAGKYVESDLSRILLNQTEAWTRAVAKAVDERVARVQDVRALAFCVDQAHAHRVAEQLSKIGLKSRALTHDSSRFERDSAKGDLQSGRIQVLATVDLFNEGINIPDVNVLFLFRPTESATVFLQQLGRGLRRNTNKSLLTVFDVTGRQHPKFRFDRHLRGLLGFTPRGLREYLEAGIGRLPAGCQMHFEPRKQAEILERVREAIPTSIMEIRRELRQHRDQNWPLETFLDETEIDPMDLFRSKRSWTSVRADVDILQLPDQDECDALSNVQKLMHVTDPGRLDSWQRLLKLEVPKTERDQRLAAMLFVVLYGRFLAGEFDKQFDVWKSHVSLRKELAELVPVLRKRNATLLHPHALDPAIPLAVHSRYLSSELGAAFNVVAKNGMYRDFYTGVEPVANKRYDLLLTTLDKSTVTKEHLAYRDYPINERVFHWQSKAGTRQDDHQGERHIRPKEFGVTPLLFVREANDDLRQLTAPFIYLGPVSPRSYQGERPISVEWELEIPAPSEFVRQWTNVA